MLYYVKRTSQTGVPPPHPVTYPRLSDAMKFACVALGSGVSDIWMKTKTFSTIRSILQGS
jgi:hypothetical protein